MASAPERGLTGEHLVDDAAEGKNVALGVDCLLPGSLFGTHVGRCPECEPGASEAVTPACVNARAIPKSATNACPAESRCSRA